MLLDALTITGLITTVLVLGGLVWLNHQTNMTTKERLAKIETDLNEGLKEVTDEIAKLRGQIGEDNLSTEANATLLRIEEKATALKDVIPNTPPADAQS